LFEEVIQELWTTETGRKESRRKGALLLVGEGIPPMFREPEARAFYVYQNIMGMTWPSTLTDLEKQRLRVKFTEGWASGELAFLAEVPFGEELSVYREALKDL
jgi:hypothetical protein